MWHTDELMRSSFGWNADLMIPENVDDDRQRILRSLDQLFDPSMNWNPSRSSRRGLS